MAWLCNCLLPERNMYMTLPSPKTGWVSKQHQYFGQEPEVPLYKQVLEILVYLDYFGACRHIYYARKLDVDTWYLWEILSSDQKQ